MEGSGCLGSLESWARMPGFPFGGLWGLDTSVTWGYMGLDTWVLFRGLGPLEACGPR